MSWFRSLIRIGGGCPSGRRWRDLLPASLVALLAAPLARLLFFLAERRPQTLEVLYCRRLYPHWARLLSRLTGWLPFSLAEVLLYAVLLGVPVLFTVQGIRLMTRPHPLYRFCRVISLLAAAASLAYALFYGLWGLNYQRPALGELLGYPSQAGDGALLEPLCAELVTETNAAAAATRRKADGTLALPGSPRETLVGAVSAWQALGAEIPFLGTAAFGPPKPVAASRLMCYTQITGIFIPYTMEANVNVAIPAGLLPATAAHEAAHQHGFAREDEANFLSFLACRASGAPEYVYSGYLLASLYAMDALYQADPAAYLRLIGDFSPEVRADLVRHNAFWDTYDGPVAEKASQNNDAYLKSNRQTSGVASYDEVVALLLAEYRVRHEEGGR